jgi:hypothetical protein
MVFCDIRNPGHKIEIFSQKLFFEIFFTNLVNFFSKNKTLKEVLYLIIWAHKKMSSKACPESSRPPEIKAKSKKIE